TISVESFLTISILPNPKSEDIITGLALPFMWVVEIPYLKGIVGTIGGLKNIPKIKKSFPC
ncbi:hypothetical protein ACP0FV_25565, partial [Escherichia coli]|uniref:hypothetical protein n=1 Tax=Escherichia coli TaxID=562 RepID=UPI003CF63353